MQVDINSKDFKDYMKAKGWRFGKIAGGDGRSVWYLPLGDDNRADYAGPEWEAAVAIYLHTKSIVVGVVVQVNIPKRPHIHSHLAVVKELNGPNAVIVTGFRGKVTKTKCQIEDLMFVGPLPMEQIFKDRTTLPSQTFGVKD